MAPKLAHEGLSLDALSMARTGDGLKEITRNSMILAFKFFNPFDFVIFIINIFFP